MPKSPSKLISFNDIIRASSSPLGPSLHSTQEPPSGGPLITTSTATLDPVTPPADNQSISQATETSHTHDGPATSQDTPAQVGRPKRVAASKSLVPAAAGTIDNASKAGKSTPVKAKATATHNTQTPSPTKGKGKATIPSGSSTEADRLENVLQDMAESTRATAQAVNAMRQDVNNKLASAEQRQKRNRDDTAEISLAVNDFKAAFGSFKAETIASIAAIATQVSTVESTLAHLKDAQPAPQVAATTIGPQDDVRVLDEDAKDGAHRRQDTISYTNGHRSPSPVKADKKSPLPRHPSPRPSSRLHEQLSQQPRTNTDTRASRKRLRSRTRSRSRSSSRSHRRNRRRSRSPTRRRLRSRSPSQSTSHSRSRSPHTAKRSRRSKANHDTSRAHSPPQAMAGPSQLASRSYGPSASAPPIIPAYAQQLNAHGNQPLLTDAHDLPLLEPKTVLEKKITGFALVANRQDLWVSELKENHNRLKALTSPIEGIDELPYKCVFASPRTCCFWFRNHKQLHYFMTLWDQRPTQLHVFTIHHLPAEVASQTGSLLTNVNIEDAIIASSSRHSRAPSSSRGRWNPRF